MKKIGNEITFGVENQIISLDACGAVLTAPASHGTMSRAST